MSDSLTSKSLEEIISFWSDFNFSKGECLFHPQDKQFTSQLRDKGFKNDLFPVPYIGDLRQAKIIFLMLNPGLSEGSNGDYGWDNRENYRRFLKNNIQQDFSDTQYPFFYLNPEISEHPGYIYWNTRVKKLSKEISSQLGLSKDETLKLLAQHIAAIELVPYHSVKYRGSLHKKLKSSSLAKRVVQDELGKHFIISRSHKNWGYEKPTVYNETGNIISYFNQAACLSEEVRSFIIDKIKTIYERNNFVLNIRS
jgi:hypothetical protein